MRDGDLEFQTIEVVARFLDAFQAAHIHELELFELASGDDLVEPCAARLP